MNKDRLTIIVMLGAVVLIVFLAIVLGKPDESKPNTSINIKTDTGSSIGDRVNDAVNQAKSSKDFEDIKRKSEVKNGSVTLINFTTLRFNKLESDPSKTLDKVLNIPYIINGFNKVENTPNRLILTNKNQEYIEIEYREDTLIKANFILLPENVSKIIQRGLFGHRWKPKKTTNDYYNNAQYLYKVQNDNKVQFKYEIMRYNMFNTRIK